MEYVYLIVEAPFSGLVTIGKSENNVAGRYRSHQRGNPRDLFICHVIYSFHCHVLEEHLHRRFDECNIKRRGRATEWFRMSAEQLQALIAEYPRVSAEEVYERDRKFFNTLINDIVLTDELVKNKIDNICNEIKTMKFVEDDAESTNEMRIAAGEKTIELLTERYNLTKEHSDRITLIEHWQEKLNRVGILYNGFQNNIQISAAHKSRMVFLQCHHREFGLEYKEFTTRDSVVSIDVKLIDGVEKKNGRRPTRISKNRPVLIDLTDDETETDIADLM